MLVLATYLASCLVAFLTDPFALPQKARKLYRIDRSLRMIVKDNLARLPVIALVYAGFFAASWRPYYSMHGTVSFFVIFTAISRAKFAFIREPLVFSDIALVPHMFRHKEIFYATFINLIFWVVAIGYVFGASFLYMWFEQTILPEKNRILWIALGLFIAYTPLFLPFLKITNKPLVKISESLLRTLDSRINTVRFGTFASILYHFIIWMGRRREEVVEEIRLSLQHVVQELIGHENSSEEPGDAPPLIVIWQSESFFDLRHFKVTDLDLPNLDALRRRASQWGRMTNVFEGGYTLRTEFAVLTGIQPEDAYADASYPYLRASHYSSIAWPKRFLDAGWSTHFVHPYDRTFFLRDKAMPLLGFQSMTMLDAFDHDVTKDGPYVSDRILAMRVNRIIDAQDPSVPGFVFVASMANHGPWEPGRCGTLTDPVEIYKELLRKADDALGQLAKKLDNLKRPVWLVFYGDHAPLLKSFADPFPDPRTDYIIVPLGTAVCSTARPVGPTEEAPWNLLASVVSYASFNRKGDDV